MATKKRGLSGIGLSADVPFLSPKEESTDRILNDWIKTEKTLALTERLSGKREEKPNTLTEYMQAASALTGMHKGLTEVAMTDKKLAEEKAERVMKEVAEREERARNQAKEEGMSMMGMLQKISEMSQENMRAMYESRIEQERRIAQKDSDNVSIKLQHLDEQFKMILNMKDQENMKLRAENERLSQSETFQDAIVSILMNGGHDDPRLEMLKRFFAPAQGMTAEERFKSLMVDVEVAKAKKDIELKDKNHELMRDVFGSASEVLKELKGTVGRYTAVEHGITKNGVPSSFDGIAGIQQQPPIAYPPQVNQETSTYDDPNFEQE